MGSIWNANLTNAEIERYAYLYGKRHLASFAAEVEDQSDLEDRHEQGLEAAKEAAFKEGKDEGMGIDTAQVIDDLEAEINRLKADHQRCRDNLVAVSDWLRVSDNHNTLAKRKAFSERVRQALNVIPRY